MLEFLDLIFFAGIAGAFIWLFIHHKQIQDPVINVHIHNDVITNREGARKPNDVDKENIKTTNEIPIEEPDRSDDWRKTQITDSFDG